MPAFLILAFLFFLGSLVGWGIEVLFRKFFSEGNPTHKWVNPGFLTGPYLPLYGSGTVILYLIASIESSIKVANPIIAKLLLFLAMAVMMTLIEYIAGIGLLKLAHLRLWDYSNRRGNIRGLICPLFSLFWAILGAMYYFLIHPHILNALAWLSNNLAFSFFVGLFYGVFIIDLAQTTHLVVTMRRFAAEKQIVIRYEELKDRIREHNASNVIRARFLFSFASDLPLSRHLADYYEDSQRRLDRIRSAVDAVKTRRS